MMKRLIIFVLLLVCGNGLYAQQLKEFSTDNAQFIKQLEKFMTASNRKDVKAITETFKMHFNGGRFTDTQKAVIRSQCDLMLKKKMRANPYFSGFIRSINAIISQGFYDSHFDDWLKTVNLYTKDLKRSKLKNFTAYSGFYSDLFEKKALRYTTPRGLQWLITSNDYKFVYEKDEISLVIKSTDLIGKRKEDSIVVKNTAGTFYPLLNIWKGTKGRVTWERAELTDKVFCTFKDYTIELKKNFYAVKEVTFYHPTFFSDPIEGSFSDKIIQNAGKNSSYPRFKSFNTNYSIKNLGDRIRYVGGFELHGSSVIGIGGELNPARMDFLKKDDAIALTTYADKYTIRRDEYIVAKDVKASIYFSEDSIHHPSADFRFNIPNRTIELTRTGSGNSRTLFYNSFHNMEMDVEKIGWAIDTDSIEVGQNKIRSAGGRPKEADFESLNYFDFNKYVRYQNISNYNPISTIKAFCEKNNTREIDAEELAKHLNPKYSVRTITPLLLSLVENGFIFYNKETGLIVVNEKVFHYSEASRKKRDYDNIRIVSQSRRTNGTIHLNDNALEVNGVRGAVLSDSQLVAFRPYGQTLKIQKNRNIDFNGRLFAGYGVFHGFDFQFKYNEFRVYANKVDSFLLRIEDRTQTREYERTGRYPLKPLNARIENMVAEIQIDEPTNKSSRDNHQHLPKLFSTGPCYVYYDAKGTQNGAYNRDSFYFQIKPFEFDSLDSFDPENLKFDGDLVSAGVFPEFEQTLRVQKDLSLGFKTVTPPEGYPLYKGKGRYKGIISMDNKGLLGEGVVSYLAADINSEDIIFLPSQLLATAEVFSLEEFKGDAYEFPRIRGEQVSVDWRPYRDSMYIETEEKPFEVFDSRFSLTGLATLTPGGLYGDGILDWPEAAMISDNLRFRARGVTADSTSLRIKTSGAAGMAFSTVNVKADIDFEKKLGKFKSNSDEISTAMPYVKYRTSMDEFNWDMNLQTIDFKSKGDKATFLSVHPDQDSLSFTGTSANYSLPKNQLKVQGVDFIQSADAFIYPKDGLVEIEANAKMKTLEEAVILADTSNRYHTIRNANVTILGKENYKANGGAYEYNVGDIKQEVRFSRIDIVKSRRGPNRGKLTTVGEGNIIALNNFYLDKKTFFQGTVKLRADQKELQFDGFAKINSPAIGDSAWFSIDNQIDRKNVILKYDSPRNLVGQKLRTGIFVKRDTGLIYPRILTAPYSRRDRPIFETKGFIKYFDTDGLDEFRFGDSTKVLANSRRGNQIIFDRLTGDLKYEGKFSLVDKLPYVTVDAAGEGSMSIEGGNSQINIMLAIDLIIPDRLLNIMIKDFETNSFEMPDATYSKSYVRKGLAEFIPNDKSLEKVFSEIKDYDKIYLPKESKKYTFLFGNAPMVWSDSRYSLISKPGISLSYINDKSFHKRLKNTYIEIRMSRSRDEINLYFESPSGDFYFFNYQNRVLSVVSENPTFNDAILGMKKKELEFKMPDGEFYEVKPTGLNAARFFLQRVKQATNK